MSVAPKALPCRTVMGPKIACWHEEAPTVQLKTSPFFNEQLAGAQVLTTLRVLPLNVHAVGTMVGGGKTAVPAGQAYDVVKERVSSRSRVWLPV